MAKQRLSVEQFISTGKSSGGAGTEIEFSEFSTGSGTGGGKWRKTGATGLTPSQTPAQLGATKFTDSIGDEWELVGSVLIPEQLGANGIDDTLVLDAFFSIPNLTAEIRGHYKVTRNIEIENGLKLSGTGSITATGQPPSDNNGQNHYGLLLAIEKSNIDITGVKIDVSAWKTLPTGAASLRCITFRRCTDYTVTKARFHTTGGGVASIGCKHYKVNNNAYYGYTPENLADGIIDNWPEFDIDIEDFDIIGNVIRSNGNNYWGILVNSTQFEQQSMHCSGFNIGLNRIYNTGRDGIWVGGRAPTAFDFSVYSNLIDIARKGISLSDCSAGFVYSNRIKNTTSQGIELWEETENGGNASVFDSHIYDNELENVASSSSGQPVAIWVNDNSTGNIIHSNKVKGSTHYYGLLFGANAGENIGYNNTIEKGRDNKKIRQFGALNRLDDGEYTPSTTVGTNVTSATPNLSQYCVNSEKCTIYFKFNLSVTNSGQFSFTFSVPISSDFVTSLDAMGSASNVSGSVAVLEADTATNTIKVTGNAVNNGNFSIMGSVSYLIK